MLIPVTFSCNRAPCKIKHFTQFYTHEFVNNKITLIIVLTSFTLNLRNKLSLLELKCSYKSMISFSNAKSGNKVTIQPKANF